MMPVSLKKKIRRLILCINTSLVINHFIVVKTQDFSHRKTNLPLIKSNILSLYCYHFIQKWGFGLECHTVWSAGSERLEETENNFSLVDRAVHFPNVDHGLAPEYVTDPRKKKKITVKMDVATCWRQWDYAKSGLLVVPALWLGTILEKKKKKRSGFTSFPVAMALPSQIRSYPHTAPVVLLKPPQKSLSLLSKPLSWHLSTDQSGKGLRGRKKINNKNPKPNQVLLQFPSPPSSSLSLHATTPTL